MNYLWCITKDWDNPADGERWHKAKSEETATTAGVRYIRKNTHHYVGSYLRFTSKKDGSTVVDFGNHVWFILIREGGRLMEITDGDLRESRGHAKTELKSGHGSPPRTRKERPMNSNGALRGALENLVHNIELRASAFDIFSIVDRKAWMDAKAALVAS